MAKIKSVNNLLKMNLDIPDYQRPYKWDTQNIKDLLQDIQNAFADKDRYKTNFKYRVGTIILHKDKEIYHIVDGQQRVISLLLLKRCLEPEFTCPIFEKTFTHKITQKNIHDNYMFIREYFSLNGEEKRKFVDALKDILEVVVICVDKETEAFQLFDSQNARGRALDPHDLLKAYHLREMKKYPYEMKRAVEKWEAWNSKKIKDLFDIYLFPIWNWSRKIKSKSFTMKEIDIYKGVREDTMYFYAKRVSKAMPYFQITEPFIAGNDFFGMVEHYIHLLRDVKSEICDNPIFSEIKEVLCDGEDIKNPDDLDKVKCSSAGFKYAKNLFYCALLCYYDKFHNFDEMAVKKLFSWAFMLRVDMENLGFDSINKYAIGDENSSYTNTIGIFSKINMARLHSEITGLQIAVLRNPDEPKHKNWKKLYDMIKKMNGYGDK